MILSAESAIGFAFYQKMGFQKIREDKEMNWYEIRSK